MPGFAVFAGTRGGGIHDDLSRVGLREVGSVQCVDGVQPGAAHLVLPRMRKHGTCTQGAAIPERVYTIVLDYRAHTEHEGIHFKPMKPTRISSHSGGIRSNQSHLLLSSNDTPRDYASCN